MNSQFSGQYLLDLGLVISCLIWVSGLLCILGAFFFSLFILAFVFGFWAFISIFICCLVISFRLLKSYPGTVIILFLKTQAIMVLSRLAYNYNQPLSIVTPMKTLFIVTPPPSVLSVIHREVDSA